ncbi:LytR/AlgR family response regulator transcription factor [Aestuariibacter salexigens]|uniref:LytR/AlgR family response regulator transcription factor n=1 Tax=Aestuariibacter salexigens TaxID=226010 RepID=UPI0004046733|nr:LytTR family DNA-binding domain-containing protein [Aestuariibacter salexigens]
MQALTVVIADDEPLAREGLAARLDSYNDIKLCGQCADGKEALQVITETQPMIAFLDIEMPGLSGVCVAESLSMLSSPPLIVFSTAHANFAHQAFDCHAFDYLLKPYSDDRLEHCLEGLRARCQANLAYAREQRLSELLARKTGKSLSGLMASLEQSEYASAQDLQQTISVKSGTDWLRIALKDILWIEAAGDYMCIHTSDDTHIIRKTLRQFEQELDVKMFPRINRSTIVNLSFVTRLSPNSNGEYVAHLQTGAELKVTRKYKFRLDELQR